MRSSLFDIFKILDEKVLRANVCLLFFIKRKYIRFSNWAVFFNIDWNKDGLVNLLEVVSYLTNIFEEFIKIESHRLNQRVLLNYFREMSVQWIMFTENHVI